MVLWRNFVCSVLFFETVNKWKHLKPLAKTFDQQQIQSSQNSLNTFSVRFIIARKKID